MRTGLWNRQLALLFVGNVFEFYNFSLFVMFGERLSSAFFPNYSDLVSYALFAIGFIARPFGGLLFGYVGDVWGRRQSLALAVVTLSLPTIIIGLLPGYGKLGVFAQIIVLLCRLFQGVSINGEYISSSILALEKRGVSQTFTSCILTAANSVGTSLALIVSYVALPFAPINTFLLDGQLWRFWFLLGGSGSIFYLWWRFAYIKESEEFVEEKNKARTKASGNGGHNFLLTGLFKRHFASVLIVIGIGAFGNAVSYSVVVNVKDLISAEGPSWLKELIRFTMVCLPVFTYPALGLIFAKAKPENVMISISAIGLIFIYPAFCMLNNSSKLVVFISGLLITLLGGGISGPSKAVYKKLFPINCRCSGIAVGKGIGGLLFGGLTPLLNIWLIEAKSFGFVAGYMAICAGISLLSLLQVKKKSF